MLELAWVAAALLALIKMVKNRFISVSYRYVSCSPFLHCVRLTKCSFLGFEVSKLCPAQPSTECRRILAQVELEADRQWIETAALIRLCLLIKCILKC